VVYNRKTRLKLSEKDTIKKILNLKKNIWQTLGRKTTGPIHDSQLHQSKKKFTIWFLCMA